MIIEEIKNIKSGKKELRQFGVALGIVLGLLGGLSFLREEDYYFYFLILSITFLFLALVVPGLLRPAQKTWMAIAILIGWLLTRLILIVLFYLVVTPIGILAKLFGERFLDIRFDANVDSYWIPRETSRFDKRSYEDQF